VIPIEIIAFLVGHITGWGEGAQRNLTMKDLVISGAGSALISLILTAVIGFGVPVLGGDPVGSLMGQMTGLETVFPALITSAAAGFVGTYWGYFARVGQEQLQQG